MRSTPGEARLIPVPKWELHFDWPSEKGWRRLIANSARNGLISGGVIKRVGRRILIDVGHFYAWVEQQQSGDAAGAKPRRATHRQAV